MAIGVGRGEALSFTLPPDGDIGPTRRISEGENLMNDSLAPADFSARDAAASVDRLFVERWSPRSYRRDPIPEQDLKTIIDAARFSPSCYNDQPWLFITCTEQSHDRFAELLIEANQKWAANAPVIGFLVARKHFSGGDRPNHHARFDCGAAWLAMTLQARMLGYYTHGMAGIHYDAVAEAFDLDAAEYDVVCGFTIGHRDAPEKLPEKTAAKEHPSPRRPLGEIWQQR